MRIFSASLKAVLLFAVLWLGCEFGSWLCRKNIFFSGTESAAFSVPGAFECNVRCNSVAATEKPILKLLGQDKKTLLQLQTRTVFENGRRI